jgi:hypothetical protein
MNSKQLVARNDRNGPLTSTKPIPLDAALSFGVMLRGTH